MVAKKRARKANPKRRSGGRRNPWIIDGKTWYEDDEIQKISTAAQAIIKASVAPKAPSAPKLSKYSASDLKIISLVTSRGFKPEMAKGVPSSTAANIIKKLDHDYNITSGEAKKAIDRTRKALAAFTVFPQAKKAKPKAKTGISATLKEKAEKEEMSLLKGLTKSLRSRSASALKKKKTVGPARAAGLGTLTKYDLLQIAAELKKGNPSGGKKMAKKKAKKSPVRRKKAGKKAAHRKAHKKHKRHKKAAPAKKRRKARRSKIAMTVASKKALGKKVKSASKALRRKKKGAMSRKYKAKVQFKKVRNPSIAESAMSIAKIAAAGAAAGMALQLANRLVKPMIDKVVPKAIADLKVGNAPVGQIAISCLVPGLLAYGLRMVKHPMAQQVSDVIIVTTAANAGQRLVAGLLPAGMAGLEPMLMGVEPQLMGEADFGEADFGEADFGEADFGAVEQFSGYGAEPVLMGSADFGAVEQFSGYGAVHQYSGYGAVEQFSGDEEYAGEDLDGEDFDGESAHGLG